VLRTGATLDRSSAAGIRQMSNIILTFRVNFYFGPSHTTLSVTAVEENRSQEFQKRLVNTWQTHIKRRTNYDEK
jgi:hypothetical protein